MRRNSVPQPTPPVLPRKRPSKANIFATDSAEYSPSHGSLQGKKSKTSHRQLEPEQTNLARPYLLGLQGGRGLQASHFSQYPFAPSHMLAHPTGHFLGYPTVQQPIPPSPSGVSSSFHLAFPAGIPPSAYPIFPMGPTDPQVRRMSIDQMVNPEHKTSATSPTSSNPPHTAGMESLLALAGLERQQLAFKHSE